MKRKILELLCLCTLITIIGCNEKNKKYTIEDPQYKIPWETLNSGQPYDAADENDIFDATVYNKTITITGNGDEITIENPYANSIANIEGTSKANGVYINKEKNAGINYTFIVAREANLNIILKGTFNHQIRMYSHKATALTLDNVTINSAYGSTLDITNNRKTIINLVGTNILTDSKNYPTTSDSDSEEEDEEENKFTSVGQMKGNIFSEGDLVFTGSGNVRISANHKHAIVSDDHIRINGGNIFIDNAISDAIHAKDKFVMDKGSLNLTATSDGIDCKNGYVVINNGSIEMNVGGKGIKSEKDTEALPEKQAINYFTYINNGTINIKAGDEGIDSKQSLTINGGEISISANGNALNSQERLSINGGSIYCYSKNSDGVDSNADIIITNGTIISYGSNAEKSGFDCNENKFIIKGGYVIGAGFKTSVPTEESTNNSIIVKGISQVLTCISNNSNNILVFEPEYSFTTLLISTPDIKTNTSYNIYQGGTMSGEAEAKYGLYLSGVYNNDGATTKEISTSNSWITTIE